MKTIEEIVEAIHLTEDAPGVKERDPELWLRAAIGNMHPTSADHRSAMQMVFRLPTIALALRWAMGDENAVGKLLTILKAIPPEEAKDAVEGKLIV